MCDEPATGSPILELFMIVNDDEIARYVVQHGVTRLFVDIEVMNKAERQAGLSSWLSNQSLVDAERIRIAAPRAHLMVRINPMHEGTAREVEAVCGMGADSVMLPMFRSADEVARFVELIGGRAEPVPLVETTDALQVVPRIAERLGLSRVHFGLNDLHLELKSEFMFQPVADGMLDDAAASLRESGTRFGIGGLARWGEGEVPPKLVLAEHVRLGSDAAILSRTLHRGATTLEQLKETVDFPTEMGRLRLTYARYRADDSGLVQRRHEEFVSRVHAVVERRRIWLARGAP